MSRIKSEDSRKWTNISPKYEVSFLKCDKCEVRYSWLAPLQRWYPFTVMIYKSCSPTNVIKETTACT